MTVRNAHVGEDVTLTVLYDSGGTDPDDTDSDGTPDAEMTITDNSDGTDVVSATAMTHDATGELSYDWDTSGESAGTYVIEITADFDSLTKIAKDQIRLTE